MNELQLLRHHLDLAYAKKAWHGPNLKGALRGVSLDEAVWRPTPERRNICEHVVHASYWKYSVARRLTGAERGTFGEPGSNWFERTRDDGAAGWKADLRRLDRIHAELAAAIDRFDPSRLDEIPDGSSTTFRDLILTIASHDIYHTGQIQLLKRLAREALR